MNDMKVFVKLLYLVLLLMVPVITYFANEPIREYNEKHSDYTVEMEQKYCPYCGNEIENSYSTYNK